jgi:hypothetical protein
VHLGRGLLLSRVRVPQVNDNRSISKTGQGSCQDPLQSILLRRFLTWGGLAVIQANLTEAHHSWESQQRLQQVNLAGEPGVGVVAAFPGVETKCEPDTWILHQHQPGIVLALHRL